MMKVDTNSICTLARIYRMVRWMINLLKRNKEDVIDKAVYDPYHIQHPQHPVAYKTRR